jgi:hypothetical protein
MSWVEDNLKGIDCTLCWSSEKAFLNYNGKHVVFNTIDKTLLYLETAMIQKKVSGVFVYPVRKYEIALPLCVEALYSLLQLQSSRNKVLLISRELFTRELYANLKANQMRINDVFPLGLVKTNGSITPQIKPSYQALNSTKCKFLHTGSPNFLPDREMSQLIGCVIIDTNDIDNESISKVVSWARSNQISPLIFLETNIDSGKLSVYHKNTIPVWGWDFKSLQEDFKQDLGEFERNPSKYDNPLSVSIYHIKNYLTGVKREFYEVESQALATSFKEARQLYFEIKKINRTLNNRPLQDASNSYLACIYRFERMLAPLDDTENECKLHFLAKTFEGRIEVLEKLGKLLPKIDPAFSSFWGKTTAITRQIYSEFQAKGNPKYETIKQMLNQCMAENVKVVVMNPSEPFARALSKALERDLMLSRDDLERKGVFIDSVYSGQPNAYYDKCIIFGQIPRDKTWLLYTACAKQIIYLVYPSEKFLLKYQFESEIRKMADSFNGESRVTFIKRVLSKNDLTSMPPPVQREEPTIQGFNITASEKQEVDKIKPLLQDFNIDDDLAIDDNLSIADDEDIDDATFCENGNLKVNCCKMTLDDGCVMYFKPSRMLPILKDGKRLEYEDYRYVKKGDTLIIIKNNIRDNLAHEIIRKADSHPKMQRIKFLVSSWVITLRKGMEENNDNALSFLAKLRTAQREEKCDEIASPLTIKMWNEGYTIGPQNPLNIKLIGKIYNQQFLVDNYKEIFAAVTRLRGIHQSLLRKFNEMVVLAGLKRMKDTTDDLIDDEFNLYLTDFVDIISFAKIVSILPDATTDRLNLNKKMRE